MRVHDREYLFSNTQAAIVALLWNAHVAGTSGLSQSYLLDQSGSQSKRLDASITRSTEWGTLIVRAVGGDVRARRSVYKLNLPEETE